MEEFGRHVGLWIKWFGFKPWIGPLQMPLVHLTMHVNVAQGVFKIIQKIETFNYCKSQYPIPEQSV